MMASWAVQLVVLLLAAYGGYAFAESVTTRLGVVRDCGTDRRLGPAAEQPVVAVRDLRDRGAADGLLGLRGVAAHGRRLAPGLPRRSEERRVGKGWWYRE